jgi:hypothetical protein
VLAHAAKLADEVKHPHAVGLVRLGAGVASYMSGRFAPALASCDEAERIFVELGRNVAWERATGKMIACYALGWMGRLAELSRRLDAAVRNARDSGDLYAETNLRTGNSCLVWLAADDPTRATRETVDALQRWSQRGFHVQHFSDLVAQTNIDLYRGEGRAAYGRILESWPALAESLLLQVQLVRIAMYSSRARAALATAAATRDGRERMQLVRVAADDARRLDREKSPWASTLATLVRAGVAATHGDREAAAALLDAAARQCDALDLALLASAARRHRAGIVKGAEGARLMAQADEEIATQAVKRPQRMADALIPGFAV